MEVPSGASFSYFVSLDVLKTPFIFTAVSIKQKKEVNAHTHTHRGKGRGEGKGGDRLEGSRTYSNKT